MAMTATVKGKKLIVEIDMLIVEIDMLSPPRLSTSGKSYKIASSGGNQKVGLIVNGHEIVIGLNAYYAAESQPTDDSSPDDVI